MSKRTHMSTSIARAFYHDRDVLALIENHVSDGRLHLTGNFNHYFGDPDPGVWKVLTIVLDEALGCTRSRRKKP